MFEARIAPGLSALSSAAKTFFLTSMLSKTASITRSDVGDCIVVAHEFDRFDARLRFVGAHAPLLDLRGVGVARRSSCPRSTCSGLTSMTETGIFAFAKVIAMPVPIVPAPTTAAFSTLCASTGGRFGIFPSSRSAKNRWIAACACGPVTSSFEEPVFAREPELKVEHRGRFDRVDELVRGVAALLFGRHHAVRDRRHERQDAGMI